jgi:hypothetical protein
MARVMDSSANSTSAGLLRSRSLTAKMRVPSRAALSHEPDAFGYFTAIPTKAGRSLTPGMGPSGAAPHRSTTVGMSVQMPMADRFGIPNYLLGLVRFPGDVELSADTSRSVASATEAGEPVDGHPHGPWGSDDEDPVDHHDEHNAEFDDEDAELALDSPQESAPMKFDIDDMSQQVRDPGPSWGDDRCTGRGRS